MDIHSDLWAIHQFLLTIWNSIIFQYLSGGLLSYVFGIWILKKVSRLFDYIVH